MYAFSFIFSQTEKFVKTVAVIYIIYNFFLFCCLPSFMKILTVWRSSIFGGSFGSCTGIEFQGLTAFFYNSESVGIEILFWCIQAIKKIDIEQAYFPSHVKFMTENFCI